MGTTHQMTNAELSHAIEEAHLKHRQTVTGSAKETLWYDHLQELLKIQLCRASQLKID